MSLGRYGSIGVVYARVDGPLFACTCTALDGGLVTAATGAAASSLTTDHASLVSGTYSARLFGRLSFSASAYEDIHNHSGGGLLSLTIPLGRRSSANPALQYANDDLQPALQMSRSDTRPGEWGGQLYDAEGGPMTRRFAEAEYRAPWGVIGAGVDSEAGSPVIGRVTLNGSITSLDGGTFLSPPIQDSFGVVDANGRAGVPVYVENQLVGKTDASGKLLLPDLRSYGVSKVAIDPSDLALDSEAAHSDLFVRPADRSGVVATFSIKTIDQALITLVDEKGSPIPVASTAVLPNNPERFPVGYDGQLYLTGLESHNRVKVTLPNGDQCVVEFEYKRAKGDIFRAGPLVCRPDAPTGLRGRAPSTPVAPPDRAETGPVGLRGRI
jgi:outer membrane usher protein